MIEAIKTLKENICAQCAYGSDMEKCDILYCDNRAAIKALEQELCWIPVSERLPDIGSEVLVCYEFKKSDMRILLITMGTEVFTDMMTNI